MNIEVKNSWESLTFFFDGEEITKPGYVVIEGVSIPYFMKNTTTEYWDHGHTYTVRNLEPYFEHEVYGSVIELPLAKVKGIESLHQGEHI
jgi:hypothetical protein